MLHLPPCHKRSKKIEAVRRVIEDGHGLHRVATDLKISIRQLRAWIEHYATPVVTSPGRMRLKSAADQLHDLRCESELLRREQEFLKNYLGNT